MKRKLDTAAIIIMFLGISLNIVRDGCIDFLTSALIFVFLIYIYLFIKHSN